MVLLGLAEWLLILAVTYGLQWYDLVTGLMLWLMRHG